LTFQTLFKANIEAKIFLVHLLSVKIGISPFLKLWTNLHPNL